MDANRRRTTLHAAPHALAPAPPAEHSWLAQTTTRWHAARAASSETAHATPCRIEKGSPRDASDLSHHHYRAGPPATCLRILRAIDTVTNQLAGVLIVSNPTLNNAARVIAWPDAFPPLSDDVTRRDHIDTLNREVRTISRVIIDPRFRGSGIAVALVRAYLRDPLTPRTEAIAAMGRVCPFFEAAGMRRIMPPLPRRDLTLARELRLLRTSPLVFLETRSATRALRNPSVRRAIERWQRAAHLIIPTDAPLHEAAARAAGRILSPPWVFVSP